MTWVNQVHNQVPYINNCPMVAIYLNNILLCFFYFKLFRVIQRNRKVIEPYYFERPNWWDMVDKNELESDMKITLEPQYYSYHESISLNSKYQN